MVEGARLESVYTVIPYRGFESLSLRQIQIDHLYGLFEFVEREDLVRTLGSTNRQDRRFAQQKVARRVSYMDVANESLS